MNGLLRGRQRFIRWALGLLLFMDLVLLGINWRMATSPPSNPTEINLLRRRRDLLAADVARGERIRVDLPDIEEQSNTFFREKLPQISSGYSRVVDNLGAVARSA